MACRTAGKVGCGGGPLILYFPPHFREAAMLEQGVSDHGHERMTVKALPGPSLEVCLCAGTLLFPAVDPGIAAPDLGYGV
jgi:hypothetical protein